LPALEPARLSSVLRVIDQLPPPHELSVEAALREPVASGRSADLDVHEHRLAGGNSLALGAPVSLLALKA
jgi:hypothetical protein